MKLANRVMHVLIRPMRMEDLEQVQAIDDQSFSMPWPASAYRYELTENQNSLVWVAEISLSTGARQVVGVMVAWLIVDEAHIATLAVHPDYRRQGIARRMLVNALREVIQRGFHLATLEVRAGNIPAQNLYRGFKFDVVGRRYRYYRDNSEDALIMTAKNLNDHYLEWLENQPRGHTNGPVNSERQT
jgi:ribosomal-protein-alanine N-acetyltransferase